MCAKENNDNKKDFISSCCCNGMAEMMGNCFPNGEINSDCFSWMNKTDEKSCCPGCGDSEKEEKSNYCMWPFSSSPAK